MEFFCDRGSSQFRDLFSACCKIDSLNSMSLTRISYIKYRNKPLRHGEQIGTKIYILFAYPQFPPDVISVQIHRSWGYIQ